MSLAEFIRSDRDSLIEDWEAHARKLPAARNLDREELRDWMGAVLDAVADDMARERGAGEPGTAAEEGGEKEPREARKQLTASARQHAMERLNQGSSLNQMVTEYRALRGSVVRLWTRGMDDAGGEALDELIRFDRAFDRLLAESVEWYTQKLERARNLFVGVLGHDLRNPLGAVLSSAEFLLLDAEDLEARQVKAVLRIRNSGRRMQRMVDELLDFARTRLETALPISPGPADLEEICTRTAEELQVRHPERTLRVDCSGNLSGVWDGARIEQMVSNLIGNAMQHGDPSAPATITARGDADAVVLRVHNFGQPIAPTAQRTIFDPLVRESLREVGGRQRTSGLGLGLYIAQQIAVAHGARIHLSSTETGGTTFEVRLPRDSTRGG